MKLVKSVKQATDSFKELIIIYLSVLLSSATLYSMFENRSWFDGIWWAIVTALTVGYGDSYPNTVQGKIVGIVLMHVITLLVIPLIVARIITKVMDNRNEFTHEEQREMFKMLEKVTKKDEAK